MHKVLVVLFTATCLGACSGDGTPHTVPEQRPGSAREGGTCILSRGVTTAGATVEAYAQPGQEAMKAIPDGGEYEMAHISRTTANSRGRYELTISAADLSALVEDNSSFNMMIVGHTDDRYGATYVYRESQCDTALKDEHLKLVQRPAGE